MSERETRCIDAVLRYLEEKLAGERSNVQFPENEKSTPTDMRIEATVDISGSGFAFEHTLIEPYENHTRQSIITRRSEAALRSHLRSLDLGFGIDVVLPNDWVETIKDRTAFLKAVAELILSEEKQISSLEDDDHFHNVGELSEIEIKVSRNGFETIEAGDTAPCLMLLAGDYKALRPARIERAMSAKLPKLSKWRSSHETVLILENRDISLTGFHSVKNVLESLWSKTGSIPVDHLFFVNASHSTWRLNPIIEYGVWSWRKPNGLVRSFRFNEAELRTDLQTNI